MNKENTYISEIDILRMFAAVCVVVFHFGLWSYPVTIPSFQSFFQIANIFVGFFFFLSGFILVYVNRKTFVDKIFNSKEFYFKRVIRIFPIYFLALFGTSFYLINTGHKIHFIDFLLQSTFLQAWFPGHSMEINFVAWSLSVEVFFYIIFPLLFVLLVKKFKLFFVLTFFIWFVANIFTLFSAYNLNQNNIVINEFTKYFPLLHLGTFMFGMLLAKYFIDDNNLIKKIKSSWFFIISILILFLYSQFIHKELEVGHHNGLLVLVFIMTVFGVLNFKGFFKKIFNNKIFIVLGKSSYGIYIYQALVYWLVYDFYQKFGLFSKLGEELRFYIYLLILLVFSTASYYLFESKIISYFRKIK